MSVQIVALSDEADEPWIMAWAVVGDVLIEANTHALMEYMIGALKNNAGDPPGLAREHLTRISQVTNGGGAMPPFKASFTAAQIKQIAAYVVSVAGK